MFWLLVMMRLDLLVSVVDIIVFCGFYCMVVVCVETLLVLMMVVVLVVILISLKLIFFIGIF